MIMKKANQMKKNLKHILKTSVFLVLILISFSGCKTSKQKAIRDLSTYVTLNYEGANGTASSQVDFNKDEALKQINSILRIRKEDKEEMQKLTRLLDTFQIEVLNDNKDLSNGDELLIAMDVDDELLEYFDLILNKKQTVKVQGLPDPKEVDVFQGMQIDYKGYSPNLEVTFQENTNSSDFFKSVNYSVKNPPPYARGEKLTILARYDKELARKAGYTVNKTAQVVRVPKDQGYYVTNLPELDNTFIYNKYYEGYDLINKERENIGQFITRNLSSDSKLKEELADPKIYINSDIEIEPEDGLFLVSKDNLKTKRNAEIGNKLLFVYKISVTNDTYSFPTFYASYEINAITKEKDGTFTQKTGNLSNYDKYYDNILITLTNSIDNSYSTYRVNDLNNLLETEELRGTTEDRSEEYKDDGQ